MYLLASASADFEAKARAIPDIFQRWVAVRDFPSLQESLRELRPAIVLLDMDLPGLPHGARLSSLRACGRRSRIIGLYREVDEDRELDCFRHGGFMGCCWTELPAAELARVIAAVEGGEAWMKRAIAARLVESLHESAPAPVPAIGESLRAIIPLPLTHREQEITLLVAAGNSNKQIARALNITERTVKAHLTEIFRKLGISDRLMLAVYFSKAAPKPLPALA